ncbi:MAG: AgmX/PglI C-terminal domain-containing protein [Pseudomonadales bacterium]|nr:AgmX/PglI C-terminal domain-containing protein [Pseudomonadales bacterium]
MLFLSPGLWAGDVYIWVDEQGERHFTDKKPDGVESQSRHYGPQDKKPAVDDVIAKTPEPRSLRNMRLTFSAHKQALFELYLAALKQDKSLEGQVRFQLMIEPSGQVSACDIVASDFDSRALNAALQQAVMDFDFGEDTVQKTTTGWVMVFKP